MRDTTAFDLSFNAATTVDCPVASHITPPFLRDVGG